MTDNFSVVSGILREIDDISGRTPNIIENVLNLEKSVQIIVDQTSMIK